MQCYFCKRDENEINKAFSMEIQFLEKKIFDIKNKIEKKGIKLIKSIFTDESFNKLKNIDVNLLSMQIKYFMENYKVLIKLEPNLELLKTYILEYDPEIACTDNLNNLINLFINKHSNKRTDPIVKSLIDNREKIKRDIEHIKNEIKFREVKSVDFLCKYEKRFMIQILNEKEHYLEIYKDKKQGMIFLCPYCYNLFSTNQFIKYIDSMERDNKLEEQEKKYGHIKEWDFD
jgi:hypothetical protein